MTTRTSACRQTQSKGFTLVELLVVIVIIVILVGLLVPALSGARKAAKKAATRSQMQSFLAACAAFKADKQRQPGVIPTDFLGLPDNNPQSPLGWGLTMMQSAVIDLAGGVVRSGPTADVDPGIDSQVQLRYPFSTAQFRVVVDHTRVGAPDGPQYINLSRDAFAITQGRIHGNSELRLGADGRPVAGSRPLAYIPELVDSDGMPVLMWQQDNLAAADADMAAMYSVRGTGTPPGATPRPKFTWAANAGLLTASRLGKKLANQAEQTLLGQNAGTGPAAGRGATQDQILTSMTALLGNPQFAINRPAPPPDVGTVNTENPQGIVYPGAAKGEIVLHAAGADNKYLGRPNSNRSGTPYAVYSPSGTTSTSGSRAEYLIDDFDDFTEAQ